MKIERPLVVTPTILHGHYWANGIKGYHVTVRGIGTHFISERFKAGDSIAHLAKDYEISERDVVAALRFELWSRATRMRAVLKAVSR